MAKKTKSEVTAPVAPETTAPEGVNATPALPKAPKTENDGDTFTRVLGADGKGVGAKKSDGTDAKLAPQAQVIANLIEAAGPEGIKRKALYEGLPAAGLVTRQPVSRIVGYYQKPLIESGVITVTKVGSAPAVV